MLRNRQTGLFYVSEDQWTSEADCAHDFRMGTHAIQYAIDRRFLDAELVMVFPDPDCNVVVPIMQLSGCGETNGRH